MKRLVSLSFTLALLNLFLICFAPVKCFCQKPDLVITDNGFYFDPGETNLRAGIVIPRFFVVYKNKGRALPAVDPAARKFKIQIYLSTNGVSSFGIKTLPSPYIYRDEMELKYADGRPVELSTMDGLLDNASHTIYFDNVKLPDDLGELCKQGSVVSGSVIDVENAIAEADETNNLLCYRSFPVACKPMPPPPQNGKPDLIIDGITVSNSPLSPGETIGSIKVRVKNAGAARAIGTLESAVQGYFVDVILSLDVAATISMKVVPVPYNFAEDMLLQGGRISHTFSLNPGEVKEYVLTGILLPATMTSACLKQQVNVGAIADSQNKIAESNEMNNTGFITKPTYCAKK
jgi:hypothetical protein